MALFSIVYYLVLQTMRILKLLLWVLLGIFVVVLIISAMAFKMVIDFASYTDTTPKELYALVQRGLKHQPTLDNDRLNVLLLGLDYVEGRDDQSILTDSMMLLSLDAETGSVDTVAIPRDLWIDEYKTKVNALYYYGKQKDPEHPELFPKEVIEKITGIPIHHVYELRLNSLAAMIDAAGGIDIEVKKGFTDPLFPRSGIDVSTERDPEKLYETVSFEQGKEHMTGARALQYIRSRHSDDLEMGTDDARSMRQQEVVLSLISSMKQEIKTLNIEALATYYLLYKDYFSSTIPEEELVALANRLRKKALNLQFNSHAILHLFSVPPMTKHKQWVYEPNDPSWAELQKELTHALP